jgi:hypothetical protein
MINGWGDGKAHHPDLITMHLFVYWITLMYPREISNILCLDKIHNLKKLMCWKPNPWSPMLMVLGVGPVGDDKMRWGREGGAFMVALVALQEEKDTELAHLLCLPRGALCCACEDAARKCSSGAGSLLLDSPASRSMSQADLCSL